MVSLSILLIVALPGGTFNCDSHMHSFIVILPDSTFVCYTSWQFVWLIYSLAFLSILILPRSPIEYNILWQLLIVELADSPLDFDTSAKVKIIARECSPEEPQ